jgi:hypothetical protein
VKPRRLVQAHPLEGVEVGLLHRVVLVGQLAVHRVAEAEDGRAGQLHLGIHRVEDGAAIGGDPDLVDADAPVGQGHVDDLGHGHAMGVGKGDPAPAPRPDFGARPVRHLAHGLQHAAAVGVGDQAQPFLQRIGAGGMDQLGQEAFVEEAVGAGTGRPPRSDRHQRRRGIAGHAVVRDGIGLVEGAPDQHRVRPGWHDEDAPEP